MSLLLDALQRLRQGKEQVNSPSPNSEPLATPTDSGTALSTSVLSAEDRASAARALMAASAHPRKTGKLVAAAGGVIVLCAGAAGAWYFFQMQSHSQPTSQSPIMAVVPVTAPPPATEVVAAVPPPAGITAPATGLAAPAQLVANPSTAVAVPPAETNAQPQDAAATTPVIANPTPQEPIASSPVVAIPAVETTVPTAKMSAVTPPSNTVATQNKTPIQEEPVQEASKKQPPATRPVVFSEDKPLPDKASTETAVTGGKLSPQQAMLTTSPPAHRASKGKKLKNTDTTPDLDADGLVVGKKSTGSMNVSKSASRLNEAYDALAEGRLDEAERVYLEVIAKHPREKDALLGLAVIAHRKAQKERAWELYNKVLSEDPGNETATAALASLSAHLAPTQRTDPAEAENRLRQMLDKKPESPELQHELGRLLARQKRWSEAQQAFFDAHRLAPAEALYVYNLAVALDQMRKPAAALPYYEKAAQLARQGDAGLDLGAIMKRVGELRNSPAE